MIEVIDRFVEIIICREKKATSFYYCSKLLNLTNMHAYSSREKTTLAYFSRRTIISTNVSISVIDRSIKITRNIHRKF